MNKIKIQFVKEMLQFIENTKEINGLCVIRASVQLNSDVQYRTNTISIKHELRELFCKEKMISQNILMDYWWYNWIPSWIMLYAEKKQIKWFFKLWYKPRIALLNRYIKQLESNQNDTITSTIQK